MYDSLKFTQKLNEITSFVKEDPNVVGCLLFGSYLEGGFFNDIDISLVLYPDHIEEESKILIKYMARFPSYFDFSIFSLLPLYIRARVQKESKILVNKEYDILCDIYLQAIREFNDFKPHYDTFLEAVKNG